jgi:hypothetical protein
MRPYLEQVTMRRISLSFARRQASFALTFATLFLLQPSTARAQSMTCNQAKAILLNSSSLRSDLYQAMAKALRGCPNDGPQIVANALRQAPALSTRDTVARQGAWALLDRRLVDSLHYIALDPAQTTERRRFFLRLLTRYVAPNATVDDRQISSEDSPSVLQAVSDAGGVVGTSPITAESKNTARYTIQYKRDHDADPTLRKLAGLIDQQLQYYGP